MGYRYHPDQTDLFNRRCPVEAYKLLFDPPKTAYEEICNRGQMLRDHRDDVLRARQQACGTPRQMFPKIWSADAPRHVPGATEKSQISEGIGKGLKKQKKITQESLTMDAKKTENAPHEKKIQQQYVPDWDRCRPIDRPFGFVTCPASTGDVFRFNPHENLVVTRAWTPKGTAIGFYDGISHKDINGEAYQPMDFLLADAPGVEWLKGNLPSDKRPIPKGVPLRDQGLEFYPYTGITNVLVTCDLKGLYSGMVWVSKMEQQKRFGGMPVIAFARGKPGTLWYVNWGDTVIRCSDKTWEMIKNSLKEEMLSRRKDLKTV